MAYYFITTRNISRPTGKPPIFSDEPSDPSYVISPETAMTLDPGDRLTGRNRRQSWADKIMKEAERPDGSGDIIFYVHGYNSDAEDVFKAHKDLSSNLKAQGLDKAVFVSYSWPSKGSFVNYLEDDSDARETAIHLVKAGIALFAQCSEPDCRIKVHVMAHSMGALVVREAFRAAPGHKITRDGAWGINQLIFFAADISASSLKKDAGEPLFDKSQRFTNYFNRHDKVLATSNAKRFLSSPRLGRHGAPASVLDRLVDVDLSSHWKTLSGDNEEGFIGDIPLSHSFYRRDAKFAKDVAHTIKGDMDRRTIPGRERHEENGRLLVV